jgi:hypothetical protein
MHFFILLLISPSKVMYCFTPSTKEHMKMSKTNIYIFRLAHCGWCGMCQSMGDIWWGTAFPLRSKYQCQCELWHFTEDLILSPTVRTVRSCPGMGSGWQRFSHWFFVTKSMMIYFRFDQYPLCFPVLGFYSLVKTVDPARNTWWSVSRPDSLLSLSPQYTSEHTGGLG